MTQLAVMERECDFEYSNFHQVCYYSLHLFMKYLLYVYTSQEEIT